MTTDCRRCEWAPDASEGPPRTQLAGHAAEAGHPLCILCVTSLPVDRPQTCLPCLAGVRRDLSAVVDLYALLPAAMAGSIYGQPGAPRDGDPSGERTIPGGDRLAMLGPGSRGLAHVWDDELDERSDDPESVAFELGRAEDDWRLTRGEPAAEVAGTVASATAYLMPRLGWAADHHPAFDEFATDVRRLLGRLRTATATDDRPERGAPCLSCGATLERKRSERKPGHGCRGHHDRCAYPLEPHGCADTGGLVDEWRCPRCRRTYALEEYALTMRSRWQLAVRQRRQEVGWTVRELAAELGITESGVRQIVRRHEIVRKGTGERNAALYDPDEVRRAASTAGILRAG